LRYADVRKSDFEETSEEFSYVFEAADNELSFSEFAGSENSNNQDENVDHFGRFPLTFFHAPI